MKKILILLSLFLVITAVAVSCAKITSGTTTPDDPNAPIDLTGFDFGSDEEEKDEKIDIFEKFVGDLRIQIYSDTVLRIEKKTDAGFEDRATLSVLNRTDWNGTKVTESEKGNSLVFTTDTFVLTVPKDAKDVNTVTLTDKSGENQWKMSSATTSFANLPSPSSSAVFYSFNDSPRVVPSDAAFAQSESEADYIQYNGWENSPKMQDYYVFIIKDEVSLREDFVRLTGSSDMVPLDVLGFWFSRYHAYKDTEVLELIDEFRKQGFPIDVFVVDTDWRSSTDGTGYRVNRNYFKKIDDFFAKTKKKNVSIVMNDHVHKSDENILSYNQLKWFNEGLIKNLTSGLSAWWYDRNWSFTLKSPFSSIHGDMMGQFMYLDISERFREAQGTDQRNWLLSNIYFIRNGSYEADPPHVAVHRNSVQWTGDIASTSASLRNEVTNMVKSGVNTSIAYYSSDIGGHTGTPIESLYIRWSQYGALSSIMRYHSTSSSDRTPWVVGEYATEVSREYMNLRYRLMPIFYTSAYENYTLGLPIARRMDFYYPGVKGATDNTQYMLGDDIIVAPLFGDGDTDSIPASWFGDGLSAEFFNNMNLTGNAVHTRKDKNIDFNWGQSSPASGVPADKFSARWEGKLTIGEHDSVIGAISDDGVRVYIDGELIIDNWKASDSVTVYGKDTYKAGSTHDIKVEYFEDGGGAVLKLIYAIGSLEDSIDTRKVYIPDGTWINTFTGEKIEGPATIDVTMKLREMPIFVKAGSVNVLSTPHDHLDESFFSDITLDIYKGVGTTDVTTHYEDDGETNAYKQGAYRLTTYKLICKDEEDGRLGLKVTTKTGNGKSPNSFDKRNVTLRIHAEEISQIYVNGEKVDFTVIEKDEGAYPFETEGGSPDGKVFTCTFSVGIEDNYTVIAK